MPESRCERCLELEQAHDQAMEEYIGLVDRQSRLFRQGGGREARDLDGAIYHLKARRDAAIIALRRHQAAHWQLDSRVPHAGVPLLGIPELDDDHAALGHIIRELALLGENNASISLVANAAMRLAEATRKHFIGEEEEMMRAEYPHVALHRESHRELAAFVEGLSEQLRGGLIAPDVEVIAALRERDVSHINTSDREYAEYALTRRAGPARSF